MYDGSPLDADVVHRNDVRMVQPAGRSRFLFEPATTVRVVQKRSEQDLDRDVALQLMIARPVHFAHAADAQRAEDLEAAEAIAYGNGHGRLRPLTYAPPGW